MAKGNLELNSFYCINCGNKSMELPRKRGCRSETFHRKNLYCPHCKLTLNHIEIKNDYEKFEFLEMFKKGIFKDEAEKSISYVQDFS